MHGQSTIQVSPTSDPGDQRFAEAFLRDGYVVFPAEDTLALGRIRMLLAERGAKYLKLASWAKDESEAGEFLDHIGDHLSIPQLNDFRLALINAMDEATWLKAACFALARRAIENLVGNELAIQRKVNLSIQMPSDDSSLLPLHSDCWDGDSPFEVVLWIPLVDCFATKSMFLLPRHETTETARNMARFGRRGTEDFFRDVEPRLSWLTVPFGSVVIFSHTVMHGNRVNLEATTRWTLNCRFKSLFSPYWDKTLADSFEPLNIRPASRIGVDYRLPDGFREAE